MNVTQFACFQRESLIKLIYDSCVQKQKLFTQILSIAEMMHTRSSKSASDDSVEDLLNQLKVMLQYTNQDISAHIDLALQQVTIAKRMSCNIVTKINLDDTDEEQQNQTQVLPYLMKKTDNLGSKKVEQKQTAVLPQIEKHLRFADQLAQNSLSNKKNYHPVPVVNAPKGMKKDTNPVVTTEKKKKENEEENEYDGKFKTYIKDLRNFEEKFDIKVPTFFLNKESFMIRMKQPSNPVLNKLGDNDRLFIVQATDAVGTQKKAASLLMVSPKLIGRVFHQKRVLDTKIRLAKMTQVKPTAKPVQPSQQQSTQQAQKQNSILKNPIQAPPPPLPPKPVQGQVKMEEQQEGDNSNNLFARKSTLSMSISASTNIEVAQSVNHSTRS